MFPTWLSAKIGSGLTLNSSSVYFGLFSEEFSGLAVEFVVGGSTCSLLQPDINQERVKIK